MHTAAEAFELLKTVGDRPNLCVGNSNNPFCKGDADWRIFRIMGELVEGFEFLTKIPKNVTVLGTKSIPSDSPYATAAYRLGELLAKQGIAVETGGGPGAMEAANKGAFENGGTSVGINMLFEGGVERRNDYLTFSTAFSFPFIRKLILTSPSEAFVFFPGGLGTMHQLFEVLTLIETKKIKPLPVILYGRSFWEPMVNFFHLLHQDFKTINQWDEKYVTIVDDPETAISYLV